MERWRPGVGLGGDGRFPRPRPLARPTWPPRWSSRCYAAVSVTAASGRGWRRGSQPSWAWWPCAWPRRRRAVESSGVGGGASSSPPRQPWRWLRPPSAWAPTAGEGKGIGGGGPSVPHNTPAGNGPRNAPPPTPTAAATGGHVGHRRHGGHQVRREAEQVGRGVVTVAASGGGSSSRRCRCEGAAAGPRVDGDGGDMAMPIPRACRNQREAMPSSLCVRERHDKDPEQSHCRTGGVVGLKSAMTAWLPFPWLQVRATRSACDVFEPRST